MPIYFIIMVACVLVLLGTLPAAQEFLRAIWRHAGSLRRRDDDPFRARVRF